MNRTANAGLLMVAAVVLVAGVAFALFVKLDGPGLLGAGLGAAAGVANLAVGWWITTRALRRGMKSAMRTLLGGFLARLVALCGLVFVFHRTESVSEVAFALSFMVFFFVYVALEIVLVERSLQGNGRPA